MKNKAKKKCNATPLTSAPASTDPIQRIASRIKLTSPSPLSMISKKNYNRQKKKNLSPKTTSTPRMTCGSFTSTVTVLSQKLSPNQMDFMAMIASKTIMPSSSTGTPSSMDQVFPTPSTTTSRRKKNYTTAEIRVVLGQLLYILRKIILQLLKKAILPTSTSTNIHL